MWLIVLEALAAAGLLVFIMWWTMFSGRRGGEWEAPAEEADAPAARPPGPDGQPRA